MRTSSLQVKSKLCGIALQVLGETLRGRQVRYSPSEFSPLWGEWHSALVTIASAVAVGV